MNRGPESLTWAALDGLAFAAMSGRLDVSNPAGPYVPAALGPLLEFFFLAAAGKFPPFANGWLTAQNSAAAFVSALRQQREHWVSSDRRRMGFIRAAVNGTGHEHRMTAFLMDAQRAARDVALLPGTTPGQLAAAMRELEANIQEHSQALETGMLAFRAAPYVFEFVAADRGIGVLASLQGCSRYASLRDHGAALETALTDGASRFGTDQRRGHGFRPIFLGLMNLQSSLRFRAGDHALLMDGTSPDLATAQLAQKPLIEGFFASIQCQSRVREKPKDK